MKGGKEEEKAVGPLFPRLHVNDTEKGGPRAPPRNKMALYEQLSIPSQRFNPSAAASSLPLPPHKGGTSAPSNSSSQSYGHERNAFSPFHMPPHAPAHSAERVHSRSDGSNIDNIWKEHERRSRLHLDNSTSNARRSIAECSSLRPQNSSNGKNSSGKNFDDEDDFRVPSFVQSGIAAFSNKSPPAAERGKLNPSCGSNPQKNYSVTFNSSIQFLNSNEKSSKHDMVARNYERNHSREKSAIKDSAELSESQQESGEKFTEPSNFAKMALDQGHRGTDTFENFCSGDAELFPESCGNGAVLTDVDVVEKMDALRARKEPCSRASLRNSHNSPNTTKKGHQEIVMKANKSLELGDTDKNDEVSDTSMEDSMSEREISPDVVVGIIGPKHFWKARRAIINQQRVFAVQVFELHRLIKVQKLIAASPDVLDGHHHLSSSPTEELYKSLPPQLIGKSFLQSEKPSKSNEYFEENTVEDQPLPAHGDNINKGPPCQIPRTLRCSGDPPTGPMASSNQPNPWCFHPPPNQWLVPVLSPSEGLIYKPYSGPCPPTGGFMAPMYGGCAPLGLPPMAKDFMSAAYSDPLSHQQHNVGLPPNYFPSPNGLPVVNPALSLSAVDQVNPLTVSCPNGQHSRSSCNISNPRREASSGHRRKFQASRDSEVQGSTASSPCEKAQGEGNGALPLFPVAPAAGSCGQDKQSSRLIRVVPHNARSATASAARIFRSIQEERQQYDL